MGHPENYPFRGVLSLRPLIEYLAQLPDTTNLKHPCMDTDLLEKLKATPELYEPIEDLSVLDKHSELVQKLMSMLFPPASWETDAYGAMVPFTVEPVFVSPLFRKLLISDEGVYLGKAGAGGENKAAGRHIRAFLFLLEKFYGIRVKYDAPVTHILSDPETGLERYLKVKMDFRFAEVHALEEPKPLSEEDRRFVLEHLTEPERLRTVIPPENFEFRGIVVLQAVDVTESEVLTALESDLIQEGSIVSQEGFARLQRRLRTLFRHPNLTASLAALHDDQILLLNKGCMAQRECIFAESHHMPKYEFVGSAFERAVETGEIIRIADVLKEPAPPILAKDFQASGARSLMVAPLFYKGECIGTLDLKTDQPEDFSPMDELLMRQIQPLFSMAIKRSLDDFEYRVQGIIKEKCTAIHPTVEWRFRKATVRHLEALRKGKASEIEPIVFKDVYPLYAVADIRGSSEGRNEAIQKDLIQHLMLAFDVIHLAAEAKRLPILRELSSRIQTYLDRIEAGLGTGDEVAVVKFLKEEVEPAFPLVKGFGLKTLRAIEKYDGAVDSSIGTVYRARKDFEESVFRLNERLATYLDNEEAKAQAVSPHYFERHRTDGVDYVIYIGASLTESGEFNELYLRNLRLWQLKVACGMALHAELMKHTFKVPLDIAQLILAQNSPLSIRFRYDEKRFDVDGAYDIRHEIIKSRIDKAMVKEGRERLTQPGRIAIVYSNPEESKEMRRHIAYLQSEGYLLDDLESLDLDDLPAVKGLRALRVGVNLESQMALEEIQEQAAV